MATNWGVKVYNITCHEITSMSNCILDKRPIRFDTVQLKLPLFEVWVTNGKQKATSRRKWIWIWWCRIIRRIYKLSDCPTLTLLRMFCTITFKTFKRMTSNERNTPPKYIHTIILVSTYIIDQLIILQKQLKRLKCFRE